MKKFTKLMLAMAVPAAMLAGNANATLISNWDYENQFGFTNWVSTAGGTTGITSTSTNNNTNYGSPFSNPIPAPIPGSSLALQWGTGANGPSTFALSPSSGAQTGIAPTTVSSTIGGGTFVPDLTLTHDNNPINGPTLKSVVLNGGLMLSANPLAPTNAQLGPIFAAFNILFTETPNQAGTCAVNSGVACPDIFVIGLGSSPLQNIFLATIDQYSYFLDVGVTGLTGLSTAACQAAGAAAGCLGFVTQENQLNTLALNFSIRAVETVVPEPGTLALLGLSLAGLGFGQYRRRK